MSEPEPAWRRARPDDLDIVREFVSDREGYAAGLSGRILSKAGRLALPARPGGLFLCLGDGIEALAVFLSNGAAFPLDASRIPGSFAFLRRSRSLRAFRPSSCVGPAASVDLLEGALGWKPVYCIGYRAFALDSEDFLPSATRTASVRRAVAADLEALYPVAQAYEKEEVLTALHSFQPGACRALQAKALSEQIVYLLEYGGRVVARAQTNARGWTRDQIGGVFVVPELRGQGLGRLVVEALVRDRLEAGRGLSLFVKETNAPATELYVSMGFKTQGPYRVDYFG